MAVEEDTSLPSYRAVMILNRLAEVKGLPESIRVDNGPEFISKILDERAYRNDVKLDFIRSGKPSENAYVESFHGKFRDECLNENYFSTIRKAKSRIEEWRIEYNGFRPHSALGYKTPDEFLRAYAGKHSAVTPKNSPYGWLKIVVGSKYTNLKNERVVSRK